MRDLVGDKLVLSMLQSVDGERDLLRQMVAFLRHSLPFLPPSEAQRAGALIHNYLDHMEAQTGT